MRILALLGVLAALGCGKAAPEPDAVGSVILEPPPTGDGEAFVATEVEVLRSATLRTRVREQVGSELAADALVVTAKSGTRVIEVGVRDADPLRAATLCNGLIRAYIDSRLERGFEAIAMQQEALAAQLEKTPGDPKLMERMKELDLTRMQRRSDVRVLDACTPRKRR